MDEPLIAVMRIGEVPSEAYVGTDLHWLVSSKANGAKELTMGRVDIAPGERNPWHRHPNCEEALYVITGEIEHRIEGTPNVRINAGEAILVPRNLLHQAINVGDTTVELLVSFSSADRETVVEEAE
jgi:quercetin dioxygenase-like cupin family protein